MALPPPQRPAPPSPSAVDATGGRARWVVPAVLTVVGIGIGVLIGALAFGGDDGGDDLTGGAADAAAGCQLLAGLPDEIPEETDDDWSLDGPYIWRLQAVGGAFAAAGAEDREYRSPGEDAETVWRAFQSFNLDEANDALADLHDWCADNG